jgi:hypothetical protein
MGECWVERGFVVIESRSEASSHRFQVWTFCGRFDEIDPPNLLSFANARNHKAPHCGALRYGAGTRRTVVGR